MSEDYTALKKLLKRAKKNDEFASLLLHITNVFCTNTLAGISKSPNKKDDGTMMTKEVLEVAINELLSIVYMLKEKADAQVTTELH